MEREATLQASLISIERKLSLLISSYHALQKDVERLKLQNANLQEEIAKKDAYIENLKRHTNASKIAETLNQHSQFGLDLKEIIDEHIREIDRCIAFISH